MNNFKIAMLEEINYLIEEAKDQYDEELLTENEKKWIAEKVEDNEYLWSVIHEIMYTYLDDYRKGGKN